MLKEKINEDFKTAFKEKKESEISTLKMLKAALSSKEKDKEYQTKKTGGQTIIELTDEDIVGVVCAETKKLRDSLALFEKGGRADLADNAKKEIEILSRYLPEQLNEEEIKKLVDEAIAVTGAQTIKDMGKVMGILMSKVKGRADSGLVGKLVKEHLSI